MSFFDFWENEILDHIFNKGSYTAPTIHVALSTTTPTDAGGNISEPSGNGYARVATAAGDWNTSSSGTIDNANDITFPQASGVGWGTVTHFILYDALTSGNALAFGTITPNRAIESGDQFQFNAGDLDISLD